MIKKIKKWLKKPFPLPWGKIANLKPGECRIRFKKTNLYLDYHIDKTTWYVTDPNEAFINNNYRDMKRVAKAQGFKNYIIEYYYKHTFWHELFNTLLHIAWGYANCYVLSMPWYLDLFDALFTGAGREYFQWKRFKIQYRGIQILDMVGILIGWGLWFIFPYSLVDYM